MTIAIDARRPRIALYSHDTQGLGHLRRNLHIAASLARTHWRPAMLLIAGAREVAAFPMPPGTDCLSLPGIAKDPQGNYSPRTLALSQDRLLDLRAEVILAALQSFQPHVVIVDKVPLGACRELAPALEGLLPKGQTRWVLGLRDVLDEPARVCWEWQQQAAEAAIQAYYDAIWVYGDQSVYDPAREYHFPPAVREKIVYTGYLVRQPPMPHPIPGPGDAATPREPFALCLVGGGQDGFRLAQAFVQAQLPATMQGLVLTGPFMPAEDRRRLLSQAAGRSNMQVLEFIRCPERLLREAACVVAMGGYNTVCEILASGLPALIVPRVQPRQEQLIRAQRLRELGFLEMLHPDHLSPDSLSCWLARQVAPGRAALAANRLPVEPNRGGRGDRWMTSCDPAPRIVRERAVPAIDLDGLARLPDLLHRLLAAPLDPPEMYYVD